MDGSLIESLASLTPATRQKFLARLTTAETEELETDYRALIRRDLHAWCIEALTPFNQMPAAHHRLLIREFEWVERTPGAMLAVNMPPGSAKSSYARFFAAWWFARHERSDMIGISYGSDLAKSMSQKLQSLIRENTDVLGYGLKTENMERWETTNGGQYLAAGAGAAVTGFRADCVVGDTKILTDQGVVAIKDIDLSAKPRYILSYDFAKSQTIRCRIVAFARRQSDAIWRIRTVSGRVVEATGNHRFRVRGGWTSAETLAVGDILVSCVRRTGTEEQCRDGESREKGANSLLRAYMRDPRREPPTRIQGQGLPELRQADGRSNKENYLFGGMLERENYKKGVCFKEARKPCPKDLRILQSGIYSEGHGRDGRNLQPDMLEPNARIPHDGREQSRLAQWRIPPSTTEAFGESIPIDETLDSGTRWAEMRGLHISEQAACPSYRYERFGQSVVESGDALLPMSHEMAWSGAFDTEDDPVAMVERVCESTEVFDIQVEGTECFFANGILVHNCVIVDDPVKGREAAESLLIRDKIWNGYLSDIYTRRKPGCRVVVIMTRWHEDDFGGRILARDSARWRVVRLPAFATSENDPLGRAIGEPLWGDDGYGYAKELIDTHAFYEREGATRDWQALYQQEPRPMEGALFKIAKIEVLDAAPNARGAIVGRGWDLAATAQIGTRDPDYTVGVKLAKMPSGQYVVLDVFRDRLGPSDVRNSIFNLATQDGAGVKISVPQDPGQAGKAQALSFVQLLAGKTVETSVETGAKTTRAEPVMSQCNGGNLAIVKGPWNAAFLDELAAFPNGTHDDQVDALARAFSIVGLGPQAPVFTSDVLDAMRGMRFR